MNRQSFKTPRGIAMYPYINLPDTQFDAVGQYKVNLRMKKEDAKELIEEVRSLAAQAFGDKAKSARLPFKTDPDTGDIIAVTKSKYQPRCEDSQTNVIPPERLPDIFGGSELVVGGTISAYDKGGNHGITMQLGSVQLVKLAQSNAAQAVQFEPVEGGFVANNDVEPVTEAAAEGDYNF